MRLRARRLEGGRGRPLVARAAAVHALAVAPDALFRIDLSPLGPIGLPRQGTSRRLRRLG